MAQPIHIPVSPPSERVCRKEGDSEGTVSMISVTEEKNK